MECTKMGDYIRGKKAYTKWDVDSDNVNIDYQSEQGGPRSGWFSGRKGMLLKALIISMAFCVGLILGYIVRKTVPLITNTSIPHCVHDSPVYDYRQNDSNTLDNEIYGPHIKTHVSYLSLSNFKNDAWRLEKARYIRSLLVEYGIKTHYESYNVSLDFAGKAHSHHNLVSVVTDNETIVLNWSNDTDEESSFTSPYVAYSAIKSASGPLVYANYGRLKDFKSLEQQGVNISGSIALIRLLSNFTGLMIANAEHYGAAGVLLYQDPDDYRSERLKYPKNFSFNDSLTPSAQARVTFGDPATPYMPSIDCMFRYPRSKMELPIIPVQTISFKVAEKLVNLAGGCNFSQSGWTGALVDLCNKISADHMEKRSVNISIHNINKTTTIYNVIGVIPGKYEADRYIILGSESDSWTYDAVDSSMGAAILIEVARAFSILLKHGWQPGRTIIFAFWAGEQFGKIGSTEWAEEHALELSRRTVAYINLGAVIKGNYSLWASGSPLLKQVLYEVMKAIPSHDVNFPNLSLFEVWHMRDKSNPSAPPDLPSIHVPNPWNEFNSFQFTLGIPSLNLEFRAEEENYVLAEIPNDRFNVVNSFIDINSTISEVLAKIVGKLVFKLSVSAKLPMNCSDYADLLRQEFTEFYKSHKSSVKDIEFLDQAIKDFEEATEFFHSNFSIGERDALFTYHEYNDQLITVERALLLPPGMRSNTQHRHIIFHATTNESLESIVFSNIVDEILSPNQSPDKIALELSKVIQALKSATNILKSSVLHLESSRIFD